MKLAWRDIEPFVKSPNPKARVILIYGPDNGLMKERGKIIGQTIVADLNDPFNAITLSADKLADDPALLSDEANAISMMGGARLIRIEDGADKITPILKDYLDAPSAENLVIVEAGELSPRSTLRSLCEKAPNAAALPCYVEDERAVSGLIRDLVRTDGKIISNDAVAWLAANITGDRARARNEIEKLLLYMGTDQKITIDHVIASSGEAGAQNLDDLVYAVAGGNKPAEAMRAYHKLIEEGIPVIAILRALQNHFRKLHYIKARIAEGDTIDSAVKTLSPPLFFKLEAPFKAQVNRWPLTALEKILTRLADIEADTKKTGTPVETLCAQAILGLSAR